MGRPSPAEYQPQLTVWNHLWRGVLMAATSVFVWFTVAEQMTTARAVLDVALHSRRDGSLGTVLSYTGLDADGAFDVEETARRFGLDAS